MPNAGILWLRFMPIATSHLMTQLQPQAKLWIEIDGKIALSQWRVALLEAVQATGSLSKASSSRLTTSIRQRSTSHGSVAATDSRG
jgi:hypothetical protein